MVLDLISIVIGLAGLYFGGNWLVEGASRLARSLGLSTLIVGLTVVAIGTSTPELLVSVTAALQGNSDIAIGNVVGSNIANIGIILGATALITPIGVHISLIRREIPIMIAVTILCILLLRDGQVSRIDGAVLIVGTIVFTGLMIYLVQRDEQTPEFAKVEAEVESHAEPPISARQRLIELGRIGIGILVLVIGARLTVDGATSIARAIGISDLVIGITLVAFGTSLPEFATSIAGALKKESDIVVGNIVGSNIYNILLILGMTAVIRPVNVDQRVIDVDSFVMLGFAVLLLPLVITNRELNRREAVMLLVLYGGFLLWTFTS